MAVTLNLNLLNPLSTNQKTQPKPNGMLHPDLFHMQGYTKTQNKVMEKDLRTKWRAKINK